MSRQLHAVRFALIPNSQMRSVSCMDCGRQVEVHPQYHEALCPACQDTRAQDAKEAADAALTAGKKAFFLTFGQKWRNNPHPAAGHPDGWFRIMADDEAEATRTAERICGKQWSMIYPESAFDPSFYPRGELRVL